MQEGCFCFHAYGTGQKPHVWIGSFWIRLLYMRNRCAARPILFILILADLGPTQIIKFVIWFARWINRVEFNCWSGFSAHSCQQETCLAIGTKLHSSKEKTASRSSSCFAVINNFSTKNYTCPLIVSSFLSLIKPKIWPVAESIEQLFWRML